VTKVKQKFIVIRPDDGIAPGPVLVEKAFGTSIAEIRARSAGALVLSRDEALLLIACIAKALAPPGNGPVW